MIEAGIEKCTRYNSDIKAEVICSVLIVVKKGFQEGEMVELAIND